jgi:hypothetical protein
MGAISVRARNGWRGKSSNYSIDPGLGEREVANSITPLVPLVRKLFV